MTETEDMCGLMPDGTAARVRMSAAVYARLRHWIAFEFAWTVRLFGEVHGAKAR